MLVEKAGKKADDQEVLKRRMNNDKHLFGGNKEKALERDGYRCVKCGMTNEQHVQTFGRRITVDHIDGKGCCSVVKNNDLNNLQTLCLRCHGSKDGKRGGKRHEKEQFVIQYFLTKGVKSINILNKEFVKEYVKTFSYSHSPVPYGLRVEMVGRLLLFMQRKGTLTRKRVGIVPPQDGFPRWVYCYEVNPLTRL